MIDVPVLRVPDATRRSPWGAWRQWVAANMAGEVVGFGLAAAIGSVLGAWMATATGAAQVGIAAVLVAAVGVVEGSVVGGAQWLVLRRHLARLSARAWVTATVGGATLAWGVGMLVGSLAAGMMEGSGTAPDIPPAAWLAGPLVIGAVAGSLLASVQWWVLHRLGYQAGWWVPAHALGWAGGMVVAFGGMAAMPDGAAPAAWIVAGGGIGLAMGFIAAAVSGLALVALVRDLPAPSQR
jgi:hypothetical protein